MSEETNEPQKMPTAQEFGDLLRDTIAILAIGVQNGSPIKNYLEMRLEWDEGILPDIPFRKVALTFYRDGGISPHQARVNAEREIDNAERVTAAVMASAHIEKSKLEARVRQLEAELANLKEKDLDHDR